MPNLSMSELLLIVLVGLLVFGPRRLPEITRNLGKAWRVFQEESRKATAVFKESFEEVETISRAGVIDQPDGAPKPRRTLPPPTPEAIEAAATVEVAPERIHEDT